MAMQESVEEKRYREALHLLYTLNNGPECRLSGVVSCSVCPFSLGGPCALKSVLFSAECHKGTEDPGSYPRSCMERIAEGVTADAWSDITGENRARIKAVVNKLRREEGKPGVQ